VLDDIGSALRDGPARAEQEAPRAKATAEANGGRAAADLRARAEVSPAARTDELPLHRDGGGAYAPDGGPTHARWTVSPPVHQEPSPHKGAH
jgi:hypothetical protein